LFTLNKSGRDDRLHSFRVALQFRPPDEFECRIVVGGMGNSSPHIAEEAFERQITGNPKTACNPERLIGGDQRSIGRRVFGGSDARAEVHAGIGLLAPGIGDVM
jgi:hypothetical protein